MPRLLNKISFLLLINLSIGSLWSAAASASPTSLILITELQTGQGSSEFIEIENTSDSILDLTGWKLQYHSSTSQNWSTKNLSFLIPNTTSFSPGDRALLSASGYSPPDSVVLASFPSGLADSGGAVRIVPSASLDESLGDKLAWGVSDAPICSIAPRHGDRQSLKRFPFGDGVIVDSSMSGKDFYVSNSPSPDSIDTQDPFSIDEVVNYCGKPSPGATPDPTAPGAPEDPGLPNSAVYQKVEITEIFPDPVSPQTDENDEYIELFNPNQEAVNISGYKLQTGMNFTYSYLIGDITIQPGEYYSISRKDSGLTLSNTSSRARLLDPAGETVSETEPYDQSNPAQSWQTYGGTWQWSETPTPSAGNLQLSPATSSTAVSKVTAKPAATKTTAPKKAKAAKKSSKKSTLSAKPDPEKKDESSGAFTYTDDTGTTRLQPYILWGAGTLLLGYGLWEYRWDIFGMLKKVRKNSLTP